MWHKTLGIEWRWIKKIFDFNGLFKIALLILLIYVLIYTW